MSTTVVIAIHKFCRRRIHGSPTLIFAVGTVVVVIQLVTSISVSDTDEMCRICQQNAWTTFRVGFFAGIFIVLVLLAVVCGENLMSRDEYFLNGTFFIIPRL